ncbi:VirB4 family type IV secretion system protein [Lactobacillus taiwanensis]|uniref:VirB4 family type IV secretion system protein n=1 Tax=Lactobacillus taiwanensis TaxID=508451 RepID=UPI001AEC071E|nr:hypothetical protein [Lactobacillus taiwanensis]QTQ40847.1 hypothetical protein H1A07_09870 [Lactobacillus taiwanensis]
MSLFKKIFSSKDKEYDEDIEETENENYSEEELDPDYDEDWVDNTQYYEEENEEDEDEDYYDKQRAPSTKIGQPSLINILGNSYWSTDDVMQEYFIMRETMKHRTYGIAAYIPPSGYPRSVDTTIFQEVLSQGFVDITMDIVPHARKTVMKELSNYLNVIQSNADFQAKKGQTFQLRDNITKYNDIDNLLNEIQFDEDRLYDVCISFIIYGNSERDMNQNFGIIADILGDKGISLVPYVKRVKSGYLQTVPIGARLVTLDDTYRNVTRSALGVMDLARNAAGRFNGGIPFALNQATPSHNTEFLNVFGTEAHRPNNANMGVVGESGSGKSVSAKLKIAREVSLQGIEHRSIDPDGEYVRLAKKLHQLNLNITADADFIINPCAVSTIETPIDEIDMSDSVGRQLSAKEVEEQIRINNDGEQIVKHEDGEVFIQKVNIASMISNVESFVNVILKSLGSEGGLTPGEIACLETAITAVIDDFGITKDPNSLFEDHPGQIGTQYYDRLPKPEPTLTDIYDKLELLYTGDNGKADAKVDRLLDLLKPYLRTGSKPLFDGQTNFGKGRSKLLNDYTYVNFNISQLTGSLKNVAYYVITQYLWERWMKNPTKATVKKVLDADEILQFIDDPEMSGFFEIIVRRCRKRNGALCWMSQDIKRLKHNDKADALYTNSDFMLFLGFKSEYRQLMKDAFDLTDGALDILTEHPDKGEGILKAEGENLWIRTNPGREEWDFVESNKAVEKARKTRDIIDQINKSL